MAKIFGALFLCLKITFQLSCNFSGESMQWYALIKVPKSVSAPQKSYLYLKSSSKDNTFSYSEDEIDATQSPLASTLEQLDPLKHQYAIWNDENPNGQVIFDGAHSKGVLAYDSSSNSGFYLIHSVPKYPFLNSDNTVDRIIRPSQEYFGQNFFCLNLEGKEMDKLVQGLLVPKLNVYFNNFKPGNYENLNKLANNITFDPKSPNVFQQEIEMLNGDMILGIFKNSFYLVRPYEDVVSPILKVNILVESFGDPFLPSNCSVPSGFTVKNIQSIKFQGDSQYEINWINKHEHSKWLISDSGNTICISGMNNMASQAKRGGVFLCQNNDMLYNAFKSLIDTVEDCNTNFLRINK